MRRLAHALLVLITSGCTPGMLPANDDAARDAAVAADGNGLDAAAMDADVRDAGGVDARDLDARPDSSTSVDDAATDADEARLDGAPDAVVAMSDAGADSGSDAGSDGGIGCRPGDVSAFAPPTYRPPTPYRTGVCTPALMASYDDSCLDGDGSTCLAQFGSGAPAANRACANCILSFDDEAMYGPLVNYPGWVSTNFAGCFHLTGGASGEACARNIQALDDCLDAACRDNCPITDGESYDAHFACRDAARAGGCATYAGTAVCAGTLTASGGPGVDLAACARAYSDATATFRETYDVVTPAFCGP